MNPDHTSDRLQSMLKTCGISDIKSTNFIALLYRSGYTIDKKDWVDRMHRLENALMEVVNENQHY